jgi:hypothetical protein
MAFLPLLPAFPADDAEVMSLFPIQALARLPSRLRQFHTTTTELNERLWLLNRPWEENFLHWAGTGQNSRLHGTVLPPADGRRHSVTKHGWCQHWATSEPDHH